MEMHVKNISVKSWLLETEGEVGLLIWNLSQINIDTKGCFTLLALSMQ